MRVLAYIAAAVLTAPGLAPAADLFDPGTLHEIRLYLHPSDWQRLQENFGDNTYYPAEFNWSGQTLPDVAVRSRGLGSRSDRKPGLRLDFNRYVKGRSFGGVASVILDNSLQDYTFLHERLTAILFEKMGIAAARVAWAKLYINDAYAGLYVVIEDITESFTRRAFGEDSGDLYEYHWLRDYRFEFLGDDPENYLEMFEPRNHERNRARHDLVDFIRTINDEPDATFEAQISRYVDIDMLLTYIAVEHYAAEWDGLLGSEGLNNFYLYRRAGGQRFQFIPWDKDVTFWDESYSALAALDQNLLVSRLFRSKSVRARYLEILSRVADEAGEAGGLLDEEAQTRYAMIREAALADTRKMNSNEDFESQVDYMRYFIQNRKQAVMAEVASHLESLIQ